MRFSLLLAAIGAGLAGGLPGCAGPADNAARLAAAKAEALLVVPAGAGEIFSSERETVTWQGQGELVVTPTALFMNSSGRQRVISYATVTAVTVRGVQEWVPLGRNRMIEHLLVVETSRPTCNQGCVFRLEDPATANTVAELIEAQRLTVDPFGRQDAHRQAWLATGLRNARPSWRVEPAYLQHSAPDRRRAVEEWFCRQTGCSDSGATAAIYGAALGAALPRDPADGFMFRELQGVAVNLRSELSTTALAAALATADPGVARLLVSDLDRIELAEKISPDYVVSVEATFRAFVDYFDLAPLKDGHYFYLRHTVSRPLDEWLSMDGAGFEAELRSLAEQVARRVREDLAPRHRTEHQGPGNPSGAAPPGRKPHQGE